MPLFLTDAASKIANKIHISEKKSNLGVEKRRRYDIIYIKEEIRCKYAYTI